MLACVSGCGSRHTTLGMHRDTMALILLVVVLIGVLPPCAHAFTGAVGVGRLAWPQTPLSRAPAHQVRMLGLSGRALAVGGSGGRRVRKRPRSVLMGTEEVGVCLYDILFCSCRLELLQCKGYAQRGSSTVCNRWFKSSAFSSLSASTVCMYRHLMLQVIHQNLERVQQYW